MKKSVINIFVLAVIIFGSAFVVKAKKKRIVKETSGILDTVHSDPYKIGDAIHDFSLMNIDGKMMSLKDMKDAKGYIIVFTCNHCPYAVAYEDRLIELNNKYKDLGYPVVAINPNDSEDYPSDNFDSMIVRAKEKGFNFPYLFDKGQKVYPQFGATKTPHVFVVEKTKEGDIVQYIGAIDDNHADASAVKKKYLENAVDALLAGKKVKVTETKAIGCSIKK